MPLSRRSTLLSWALLPCLAAPPAFAAPHDPQLDWYSASSPHFDLHFHQGLQPLAPRVAALCERRYAELSGIFQFHPTDRIGIVLADEDDEANGSATAWPSNTVTLIVAPPSDDPQVFDTDEWLATVVDHELTHIFHLDHASGVPAFFRHVLGRNLWTMPAYFQPAWVHEGLATWAETDAARGVGRAQSPYFRGLMRLELQAGLKGVRRVNLPQRRWPLGSTRYLYGAYFLKYLEATRGREGVRRWVDEYSDDWLPYFINHNAKKALGKPLPGLWRDFRDWLKADLGAETAGIIQRGLRGEPAPVDPAGGDEWGPYKAGIAVRRDGRTRPRFQQLQDGHWRDLGEAYPSAFWPTDQRILFTEDEVTGQAAWTRDLWQMDRASGARTRLTHGLRVQEAVEAGGQVLALLGAGGEQRLVRLQGGAVAATLWQGVDGEVLSSLCLSPDAARLAASHWRRGRGWDVDEMDIASGVWTARASRAESEVQPSYSEDGRTLYFSAAYGGAFNIYALGLADGALRQLTRVVGAALHPWPGPAGQVYFTLLTAHGGVLGQAPLADAPLAGLAALPPARAPQPKPLSPTALSTVLPYSPWPSLWPTGWVPLMGSGWSGLQAGLEAFGGDALGRHQWALEALGGMDGREWYGFAGYGYDRWWPQLWLQASQRSWSGWGPHGDQLLRWSGASGFVDLPWLGRWRDWGLSLGLGRSWWTDEQSAQDGGRADSQSDQGSLGLTYDGAAHPANALGPVDGLQFDAVARRADYSDASGLSWVDASLGRPCSLGHGLELEDRVSFGRVVAGDGRFGLAWVDPLQGQPERPVAYRPELSLIGYESWAHWADRDAWSAPGYLGGHVGLRIPIASAQWGIMAPPIGVDRVYGKLWYDAVRAAGGEGQASLSSAVAEVDVDWILFYAVPVTLRAGYGYGLDPGGFGQFYLSLQGAQVNF